MTPSNHTSPDSTPERVGDVPAARLLRVIADRIDQGWPAPDEMKFKSRIELVFFDNYGDVGRADQWITLFDSTVEREVEYEVGPQGVVKHHWCRFVGHRGNHLDLPVRVSTYQDIEAPTGGEPR